MFLFLAPDDPASSGIPNREDTCSGVLPLCFIHFLERSRDARIHKSAGVVRG